MGIKIDDTDILQQFLEETKVACLYCLYYNPEVGCDRIYKRTKGKMKIDIPDPLHKECESFEPIFRCEDCKYFRVEKMEESFAGRDKKYICLKTSNTDENIQLCMDYTPNEEKKTELEERYEKAGFTFVVE